MGRISLDSTTGAQFVNYNGDVLGWNASDLQLVNTVAGQFTQPGDAINRDALADCVALLVDGLDGSARDDVYSILTQMLDQAPASDVCGYILGGLLDLDTANYAHSVLDLLQNHPTMQALLTGDRVARLNEVITAGDSEQQIALIMNLYQTQVGLHPRTDYSHANAQQGLNSVTQTGDMFGNPTLNYILDHHDAEGLKAAILQAQADGTAEQLVADLQLYGDQAVYMLDQLMADGEVGRFAFHVVQTMPTAQNADTSISQQHTLDADLVRSLLTQPTAAAAAIAHDYNTVAFRAHAIGQLVRTW